jgi:thymidine kinase
MKSSNNTQNTGYLHLIMGPMFSGKTTRLIELYHQCNSIPGTKIAVLNYYQDTRYGEAEYVTSHDQDKIPCIFLKSLEDFQETRTREFNETQIIFINEGQFFPDLREKIMEWTDIYGKHIYICGLNGDYKRNPFDSISSIIPYSDKIELLYSTCSNCGEKAIFSHRISHDNGQVVIGVGNYIPLCRNCFSKPI